MGEDTGTFSSARKKNNGVGTLIEVGSFSDGEISEHVDDINKEKIYNSDNNKKKKKTERE